MPYPISLKNQFLINMEDGKYSNDDLMEIIPKIKEYLLSKGRDYDFETRPPMRAEICDVEICQKCGGCEEWERGH